MTLAGKSQIDADSTNPQMSFPINPLCGGDFYSAKMPNFLI